MNINKKILLIFIIIALFLTSCVQQSNTYPVEIFSEMHYNQAQKYQEPPRVPAHPDSIPYSETGYGEKLDLTITKKSDKDGSKLYYVNCSFCHGLEADGNGPASEKITSDKNYWFSVTGENHKGPANLLQSELSKENAVVFIKGGAGLMPAYENMLNEEEIRSIVDYVWNDLR